LLVAACFTLVEVAGIGFWPGVRLQLCPTILIASSQEKFSLMKQLAGAYSHQTQQHPWCTDPTVQVDQVASGQAEAELAAGWTGRDRPDVWAPAATTWTQLLKSEQPGLVGDRPPPSLAESPLVMAMPKEMAQALGWPATPISWQTLFRLAQDHPSGWAAYGHPQWGPFLLGKTDPTASTSGLNGLLAEYFAASGQTSGMTSADVLHNTYSVGLVEKTVAHYADTARTYLYNLAAADKAGNPLSYISLMPIEEQEVVAYDRGEYYDREDPKNVLAPRTKLVAIYPTGFTLLADHPYLVLPWVNPQQRDLAAGFLDFLQQSNQQAAFGEAGFRDTRGNANPSWANLPWLNPVPPTLVVTLPSPGVLSLVQREWRLIRKRAQILILLDVTTQAELEQVDSALSPLAVGDSVAVWAVAKSGQGQPYVQETSLTPYGSTALDKAILRAPLDTGRGPLYAATLDAYRSMVATADPDRVNAVVVLAAEPDDGSGDLLALEGGLDAQPVHVYTVPLTKALSSPDGPLEAIALAAGGEYLKSSSDAIRRALADF
jgi:Ca-activated chloride channel family protein